jgi:mRNA interferase HicA
VTANQLKRWLAQQGCTFEPGHGGHLLVRRGSRMSILPMHGSGRELGTGLVNKIKKDLGLRGRGE